MGFRDYERSKKDMPFLTTSSSPVPIQIHYQVTGTGPEHILFINGLGSIASQWDPQVSFFSQWPDEYSVCVFDNRGSGMSESPDIYYSTSEMAKDCVDLLEHLKWKKVHICGLSMGGMIAQELACLLRDRVASLTLVSTYSRFNGMTVGFLSVMDSPWPGLYNVILSRPTSTVQEFSDKVVRILCPPKWLESTCNVDPAFKTNYAYAYNYIFSRFQRVGLQNPIGKGRQQVACLTHAMTEARLKDLRAIGFPILVLTGDEDFVLRQPLSSLTLASALGAELVVYPGGGHALRMQDPDWHNSHHLRVIQKGRERLANHS